MERIKGLYDNYSRAEKKYFKAYLTAFSGSGSNKGLDFIRLIEKKPNISQEEASLNLYGEAGSKAFIMMKSRLYEKMLEILILSSNVNNQRSSGTDNFLQNLMEIRKNILFGLVLKKRGLYLQCNEAFQKAYALAHHLEASELEMDVLINVRDMRNVLPAQSMGNINELINDCIKRFSLYNEVYEAFDHYANASHDPSGLENATGLLEKFIPPLEEKLKTYVYSARAHYHILIMKTQYYSNSNNYLEGKRAIDEMLTLLKNENALKSQNRLGVAYLFQTYNELTGHQLENAVNAANLAMNNIPEERYNYRLVEGLKGYALIHLGRLDEAAKIEKKPVPELAKIGHIRNEAVIGWQKANICFCKKQYKKALELTRSLDDLKYDKAGWITGLRIFEILCLIELEELDDASRKIENLRKHMSRYTCTARDEAIFQLLAAIEHDWFSFEPFKNEEKVLKEIYAHIWRIGEHEIIRPYDWYLWKKGTEGYQFEDCYLLDKINSQPL